MKIIKGRGAQINPTNRYEQLIRSAMVENEIKTHYQIVKAKTIVNKVNSPDLNFNWSLNPYQGCEHGCSYCYARDTHPYWGFSAGVDFETKIMVKKNAASLLDKRLRSKTWKASVIMMSGNTDCYQPAEKRFGITRSLLKVFWKYRHPVSIITKNTMIKRDFDLLIKLARHDLVKVCVSMTTLNNSLRSKLEPRTPHSDKKLQLIEALSDAGIPVNVMMAPIIPGLNDIEIFSLLKEVSERGALSASYTIIRLNGEVDIIFRDWLFRQFPDRADKIYNKIKACHGGQTGDKRSGLRMSGEGEIASIISKQFAMAKRKYFKNIVTPDYNLQLHEMHKSPQLKLF